MRRSVTVAHQRHRFGGAFQRAMETQENLGRRSEEQGACMEWAPVLLPSVETPPPIARPAETAAFFMASFDPFVFSYSVFDFPSILHRTAELKEHELLVRPESMLISPRSLFLQPNARFRLGSERHRCLGQVLQSLLLEHDESDRSPVSRATALGVECPLIAPFLRCVCLCVETQHPFALQAAYVFEELLSTGFVSPTLFLGGTYQDRSATLASLLQVAASEFGSESVLFTGLLLGKGSRPPLHAGAVGRLIARTLSTAERRRLDWDLKARGSFREKLKPVKGWTLGHPPTSPQQK
ncbi:hypothetical protein JKF63_04501 [Porcisia hertigi]|uniref:Uncharacterized protein n=1 Tax=Porcisia hertigi TaxID=2761500 RepID=A0A836I4E7_9TRYP|nr:hypothetical protein JKF63_04501 [Porcisia hertigi]